LNRPQDEKGQVLSSLVAVLAVVAIVGGLLVLFGTRGNDSVADSGKPAAKTSVTPKPSLKPSEPVSSAPPSVETSAPPSVEPSGEPTSAPSK
jgi:hypothetical protein